MQDNVKRYNTSLKAWQTAVKELWSYHSNEVVKQGNKRQLGHEHHRLQNNHHTIFKTVNKLTVTMTALKNLESHNSIYNTRDHCKTVFYTIEKSGFNYQTPMAHLVDIHQ